MSAPAQNGTPRPGSAVAGVVGSTLQRPGSTVPRPGSTRPGSTVPRPGSTVPRPGSTKPPLASVQLPVGRVGTPPRTGAAGSGTPLRSVGTAAPANTAQSSFAYPMDQDKRGQKRDRDGTAGIPVNGLMTNGNGTSGLVNSRANPPTTAINARAGMDGIRARPIKKQRMVSVLVPFPLLRSSVPFERCFMFLNRWLTFVMPYQDIQGQARDVTVTQQPTPQGV